MKLRDWKWGDGLAANIMRWRAEADERRAMNAKVLEAEAFDNVQREMRKIKRERSERNKRANFGPVITYG